MTSLPSNRHAADRNAEATVHIGHLDEKVTDALLWELMVQAGPVQHVYIPRNRITGAHFGYGFCEYRRPMDAYYATKVLNSVALFSKPLRISQSTVDRVSQDVGANLFVGNLVDEVDEKTLHDAFSAFGPLIDAPHIIKTTDTDTNHDPARTRKSYGFIKYSQFQHADDAIAAMDGQYICNFPISVQYAFKKDSRERHGSQAERVLAQRALAAAPATTAERLKPNQYFSDQPASKRIQQQADAPPPPIPQPPPPQQPPPINPVPVAAFAAHPPGMPTPHHGRVSQPYPAAVPFPPQAMPFAPPWQQQPFQHQQQQQQGQLRPPQHQQGFPPYQQQQPPHVNARQQQPPPPVGWSQGRRYGSRGPPP